MKKLGIIGGLGPMATALLMKMIIEMTDAANDQEHIEMIVYNCPQIPDRTNYILGKSQESPLPKMLEIGRKLTADGAELIAIPCITANYFYEELSGGIAAPVINIIEEARDYLIGQNIHKVGLMATSGTIESRLFQNTFGNDPQVILPDEQGQEDVMRIIYDEVKANRPADMQRFGRVAEHLRGNGAEIILLGCTELSVVRENCDIGPGYLDVMQLLAKCVTERCGRLRSDFAHIIT